MNILKNFRWILFFCIYLISQPNSGLASNKEIISIFDAKQGRNVEVVKGEIIIKLREMKTNHLLQELHDELENVVIGEIPELNCQLIRLSKNLSIVQAIDEYRQDPGIEFVEPNYIAHLTMTPPNDPHYSEQWYLPHINAEAAWEQEKGSSNVIIGIIDSGLDFGQGDFFSKIWTNPGEIPDDGVDNDGNGYIDDVHGWDFTTMDETSNGDNEPIPTPNGEDDDNDGDADEASSHGTHVAGIAAARTNNGLGVAGVAWNVQILPVRIFDDEAANSSNFKTLNAMLYAGKYAKIINCSWHSVQSDLIAAAVSHLYHHNQCIIVAAASNDGINLDLNYLSPVCDDGEENMVLGVAATDSMDRRSIWNSLKSSNFSSKYVDVSAPGTRIYSTLFYDPMIEGFTKRYGSMSGTSMAAPIVSGLAALIWSQHPEWTNRQVMDQIISTTVNIDALNPGYEGQLGSGRIDLYAALTMTPVPTSLACYANPSSILANGTSTSTITAEIRNQNNQLIPDATNEVTFAITSGSASGQLIGTNPVNAVNGVATISLQSTTSPGPVTIEASSAGLTTGATTVVVYDNPTEVGGTISQSTTWSLSGSPYIVTRDIAINAGVILTIEPGVTVKFNRNCDMFVSGALVANGTASAQITFTANADNPYAKYWGGIRFYNSSLHTHSILNYCTISYGGQGGYGNLDTPLRLNGHANPTIKNMTMLHNNRNGIDLEAATYSSNIMLDITDLPYILRGHLAVSSGATLTIQPGVLMKLEGGSDIFIYGGLKAVGTPGNHIIFTSMRDDSHGGDTNGDGMTAGTPGDWGGIAFDHTIIDANTKMDYCEIYYAGQGGYGNHDCPLELHPYANPSMSNIFLANNKLNGIELWTGTYSSDLFLNITCLPYILRGDLKMNEGAVMTVHPGVTLKFGGGSDFYIEGGLTAQGTTGNHIIFTSLRDDSHGGDTNGDGETIGSAGEWGGIWFDDKVTDARCIMSYCDIMYAGCGGYGHLESPLAIDARANPAFNNISLTENSRNGVDVATGHYSSDILFNILNIPYMIRGDLVVESSATLVIEPGVILKFGGGCDFYIQGALKADGNPDSHIIFTSLQDDSHGGDTNGDGGSVGTKGNWGGIRLYDSIIDQSSILEYCTIIYSGCGGYGHNDSPLVLYGQANPVISHCILQNNTRNAINLVTGHYSADFYLDIVNFPYMILGDIVVDSPAKLTIHPGVVLKFGGGCDFWIDGILDIQGTNDDPIIFTSLKDDSFGGDSNGDENSVGIPGDWGGIRFRNSSDDSRCVLENVKLFYGGSGGYGTNSSPLAFDNSAPKIQQVSIAQSKSHGVICYNAASPDFGGGARSSLGQNKFFDFKSVGNKYALYNDGTADIFARHCYWDMNDSLRIEQNIYDQADNSQKGRVWFYPFNNAEDVHAPQVTLLSPNGGEQLTVGSNQTISWSAFDNEGISKIYFSISYNDGATFTRFDSLTSNPGILEWTVTRPAADYCRMKIQAYDFSGNIGYDMSNGSFAIIDTSAQNSPPSSPQVILPIHGEEAAPGDYLIWQQSTDPDVGDKITYTLELDDSTDFINPVIIQPDIGGEAGELNNSLNAEWEAVKNGSLSENSNAVYIRIQSLHDYARLLDDQLYYWRVKAVDNYGAESDFTGVYSHFFFNKSNTPPQAVAAGFSPKEGLEVRTNNPEISWYPAVDADQSDHAGNLHYNLQLDTDGEFAQNFQFQYATASGLNTIEVTDELTENAQWYYRVQAVDDENAAAPWSAIQKFVVNAEDEAPLGFALVYPENSARISSAQIVFQWRKTVDPDPNDTFQYQLEFCDNNTFTGEVLTFSNLADTFRTVPADTFTGPNQYWRVLAKDSDGLITYADDSGQSPWTFELSGLAVSGQIPGKIPTDFYLAQNFPNPFNPATSIQFGLPQSSNISLIILNTLGQTIRTLISGGKTAGNYAVDWDGTDESGNNVAGGLYFYLLQGEGFRECRKLLLLR